MRLLGKIVCYIFGIKCVLGYIFRSNSFFYLNIRNKYFLFKERILCNMVVIVFNNDLIL